MACRVLPVLQSGPHLAVGLLDRRLHPRHSLVDDLGDGLATLGFCDFPVTEGLDEGAATHGLEAVNLAAGVLDGEGFGIIDAEPASALLPRSTCPLT